MPVQITELTFLKQLAHRFDLRVPEHLKAGASRRELAGQWARRRQSLPGLARDPPKRPLPRRQRLASGSRSRHGERQGPDNVL
jgi:hypothetical protein